MGIQNLKELIEQTEIIKANFHTRYIPIGKAVQIPGRDFKEVTPYEYSTITKDEEYLNWKAEIEFELDNLEQTDSIIDIKKQFKKIDGSWKQKDEFAKLEAKLTVLYKHLDYIKEENSVSEEETNMEEDIYTHLLRAASGVQLNYTDFKGKTEDEINDAIKMQLRMVYETGDQTRQGESESGKGAGEVDLIIYKDRFPMAIIEALKMRSLDKGNLDMHISKVLENYDPIGCPYIYVLAYVTGSSFESAWKKIFQYLCEYDFPYDSIGSAVEVETTYTEVRVVKVVLNRSGKNIVFYLYALHIPDKEN